METPRARFIPHAFVALLAAALYLQTLGFGFVFDDEHLIVGNVFLHEPWSALRAFAHHFWEGTFFEVGYYRPIVTASFALNGRLLGWGPAGFHLVNLLLHALNAALVLELLRRLGLSSPAAWLGAIFFGVHPAAAWPVGSIVARVDLLPTLFVLLAWIAYARPPSRKSALLTGLFFLGALLCKESAVAFLAVPLLGLRKTRRLESRAVGENLPEGPGRVLAAPSAMGLALLLYLALRHWARVPFRINARLVDPLVNPLAHLPFPDRLYAGLRLSGRYLFYLLVPLRFGDRVGYYPGSSPHFGPLEPGALLGLTLLALWAGGIVLLWLRREAACAPLAVALLSFLPASNLLMPIGSLYAQNFLYMPVLGLSLALAASIDRLMRPRDRPSEAARTQSALVVAATILPLLAGVSVLETRIWRDGRSLFTAWTERFPRYGPGYSGLGVALLAAGDAAGAIPPLREALALFDRNAEAHYNLGAALILTATDKPSLEEALAHTRSALELNPYLVQARVNVSKVLLLLGRPAEAEKEAREALRLVPDLSPARLNLAESLFRQDRFAESAVEFREMSRLFPQDPAVRSPYVVSLIHVGDLEIARRQIEAARHDFPDLGWFDFCLARVEARSGHKEAALTLLRTSLDKDPATRAWVAEVEDFKTFRGDLGFLFSTK